MAIAMTPENKAIIMTGVKGFLAGFLATLMISGTVASGAKLYKYIKTPKKDLVQSQVKKIQLKKTEKDTEILDNKDKVTEKLDSKQSNIENPYEFMNDVLPVNSDEKPKKIITGATAAQKNANKKFKEAINKNNNKLSVNDQIIKTEEALAAVQDAIEKTGVKLNSSKVVGNERKTESQNKALTRFNENKDTLQKQLINLNTKKQEQTALISRSTANIPGTNSSYPDVPKAPEFKK